MLGTVLATEGVDLTGPEELEAIGETLTKHIFYLFIKNIPFNRLLFDVRLDVGISRL